MAKLTNTTIYGSANITGNFVSTGNTFDISANGGINISSANTITGVVLVNAGAGFQSVPAVTFSNTTTSGITANANALMRIVSATYLAGNVGSGYANGDYLYVNVAGSLANTLFQVTSNTSTTYGTGGINGLSLVNTGLWFTLPNYYNSAGVLNTGNPAYLQITGTSGAGIGANIAMGSFIVNNLYFSSYGSGYVEPPTITFSGGAPSTAPFAYPLVGTTPKIQTLASSMDFYGANNTNILRLYSNSSSSFATNQQTPALAILPPQSNFGTTSILSSGQLYFISGTSSLSGGMNFQTGAGSPTLTGASGQNQFGITHTPSSVNYLNVTGNTTGGGPVLSSGGSDTKVDINITPKGTGNINNYAANSYFYGNVIVTGGMTVAGNTTIENVNITSISVNTTENIVTTGNINAANFFVGTNNISQLAITANTRLTYTASTTPASNPNIGDQWYNTSTNILYEYLYDGTAGYWVDIDSPSISSGAQVFLPTRSTTSVTTGTLANNATANVQIVGYKSYILQKMSTSCAAWVRLYTDGSSRANDASRLQSTDPLAGTGVIAEFITTGANTQLVTPGVFGFNNDLTPNTTIYAAITNQSGTSNTVTVTLTLLQSE